MILPKCTAVIVGHKQWTEYTLPLVQSLLQHWPDLPIVVVDNDSDPPYPEHPFVRRVWADNQSVAHALNVGIANAEPSRWYLIMDNDVLCTGAFEQFVDEFNEDALYAAEEKDWPIFHYLIGWAFFIPDRIWQKVGPMDERYKVWGWHEVDYCKRAELEGFQCIAMPQLPFTHFWHKSWKFIPDKDTWGLLNEKQFREKFGI
jgi:GT2 family glycosyltransferase